MNVINLLKFMTLWMGGFFEEEDGVGVVEIILILVVIFILPWLIWK